MGLIFFSHSMKIVESRTEPLSLSLSLSLVPVLLTIADKVLLFRIVVLRERGYSGSYSFPITSAKALEDIGK